MIFREKPIHIRLFDRSRLNFMCDINDSGRQRNSRKITEEESVRQLTSFTCAKIFTI